MVGQRWAALGTSGRIVTVVSVIVLIALFLPWYGVSIGSLSVSVDGLHSYGLLTALGVVVVAVGVGANAPWVRGARLAGVVLEAVGAVAFLAAYHAAGSTSALSVSFGPEIGVYLALLASLVGVVAALNERRRAV
ncbi:hypothetical protein Afer_0047 [Acidimicrobium ferrooxidans DSM 10331]|uniref:Uncharacterized protein n=1 Tax=Acidimicrobium ferrooxidans (strain DSM 10331 / JCM 15462 / NBRC 103882 / ICP) TaxID=525909 RepID=C7M1H3_ACIFD|nr:hypothetical protein [Acidimicrobium ferrooxidans]ACU53022.1 hypothetical protein Afer_0047 [Acidimicrobium ferrooxidans DSM 10331]